MITHRAGRHAATPDGQEAPQIAASISPTCRVWEWYQGKDDGNSAASACRQDRPRGVIGAEVICAIDGQELGKTRAGAIDSAFDGADRAIANCGGLLVREAGSAHQNECLA